MISCISVENMRLSDSYTIGNYVSSLELMRRAAQGVFLSYEWRGPVAILAGSGNNGGDGYALACILNRAGIPCEIFTLGRKVSADSAFYADQAFRAGVPIIPFSSGCLSGFVTVVDCLLGTGFQGELRQDYRSAIEAINASGAYIVSVDINSGMNGDTGECELAVYSDLTVTIGFIKRGLVSQHAGRYMKRLVCADIGITLVREEDFILAPGEEGEGICCPHWLDINIIRAYDMEQ